MKQLVLFVCLMVVFTSVVVIPAASSEAARPWFGENNQYKCHCEKNACTKTGECTPPHKCERGWFGPDCQYADLAVKTTYSPTSAAHILTDGKDDTCIKEDTSSVTITLDKDYPFSWMRVYTKRASACSVGSIKMSPIEPAGCIKVNDPSGFFDFYCDSPGAVRNITLSGPCASMLCSVYVSGGRNVALNERTAQTEPLEMGKLAYDAKLSVDGDRNGDFSKHKTCSQTGTPKGSSLYWKVFFKHQMKILRYVIYNRNDSMKAKNLIKGFILQSWGTEKQIIFAYPDVNPDAQDVYDIMGYPYSAPAPATSTVLKRENATTLSLCEMEIYGDTACAVGLYGRECNKRCSSNCAGNGCFPSTGACRPSCKPDYTGISCQPSVRPPCPS